ncbi:GNAT family N-acetyltransferase [Gorillibacterium sp. sgz500922]|uniref:GNAT family N-acetyltransferase n=1 Tax=Gorillibacterium sp. sgz500922 TaxID=3446694 RepID=UPI003F660E94
MTVQWIAYPDEAGFTEAHLNVHKFLVRLNQPFRRSECFMWERWEWMFSLPYLDTGHLNRISTWQEDGRIVALATYEEGLGRAWFCLDPAYSHLKPELIRYAVRNLKNDSGELRILLRDDDGEFQACAARQGFVPTQERDHKAVIPADEALLHYTLPEGFRIVSLDEDYDLAKYNRVLWRGFNHPGEAPETEQAMEDRRLSLSGPHVDLSLKVAVAAPDGEFVSFCGMWHLPGSDYALVEPVATDPAYRRMGLGRAAVLEGVRRTAARGAKQAFVGSDQLFYYGIGFRPSLTETWWELKDNGRTV